MLEVVDVPREDCGDDRPTGARELGVDGPAVLGTAMPVCEPLVLQPVQKVRHIAACDDELVGQLTHPSPGRDGKEPRASRTVVS